MKKMLVILALALGITFTAQAQDKTKVLIQPTVATQSAIFSQGLEIGFQTGKNRASIVGESFNDASDDRQYFAGFKYARALHQGDVLDFLLTGKALVHVDREMALSVEPGAEVNLHFGKNFALVGGVSSPLYQDQAPFKNLNLKGAIGVQVKF